MIWVALYALMALIVGRLVARWEEDPLFGAMTGIFWPLFILGVIGGVFVLVPLALFALLSNLTERFHRRLNRPLGPQSRPPQPTPGELSP